MPSRHYSNSALNTDPGVYEPGDPYKSNFSNYPDQDDFLNQLRHHVDMAYPKETMETVDEAEAEELDPEANIIAGISLKNVIGVYLAIEALLY